MRMKETTAVGHVFEGHFAAEDGFKRVARKVVASQVGLEERGHLCISWAGSVEDKEMNFEAEHVDSQGCHDQAEDAGDPVFEINSLLGCRQRLYEVWITRNVVWEQTLGILRSPNLFQRSSAVYKPTKPVTKNPTHLMLQEASEESVWWPWWVLVRFE